MDGFLIIYCVVCVLSVFILTAVGLRFAIPKLKSLKMGQKILEIGPRWHKSKEGTPTMGGITFIFSTLVVFLLATLSAKLLNFDINIGKMLVCIIFALLNGVIGIIDDMTKFAKKQNGGLTAPQKYLLQLILAVLFLAVMRLCGYLTTEIYIPFVDVTINLGIFYYVFAVILITGIVNSVNLTDGIDGLCSSVTLVVGIFFMVAAFKDNGLSEVIMASLIVGATLGFLVYNAYPAKIFMGDTGSLYLGGLVVAFAFMIDNPLILILSGIIYVCESLSDILQVGYFKLSHGKRLFKMAPIHHHFERCGWSENKIVIVFSSVTAAFCVLAYFGLNS